jgi:hypothetical protein
LIQVNLSRSDAERVSVLPNVCAISVVSFTDALGLKHICAPLAPVLFLGLLIGRLLAIKELSFTSATKTTRPIMKGAAALLDLLIVLFSRFAPATRLAARRISSYNR